jgi:ribosome recycling factor
MTLQDVLADAQSLMGKSLDHCKSQISKVRTGRASATLVDNVKADFYGSPTAISQMATISVPDARTIVIQPWDRNTISTIEKAIMAADLGFNPKSDGVVLRIPVPPLTEERRMEFVKLCKRYAEEGKVAVRNVRREIIDQIKKYEKDKVFTEDDRKKGEEDIQKITDDFVKKIDEVLSIKEKELLDN